jgi:hypothetical protein
MQALRSGRKLEGLAGSSSAPPQSSAAAASGAGQGDGHAEDGDTCDHVAGGPEGSQ